MIVKRNISNKKNKDTSEEEKKLKKLLYWKKEFRKIIAESKKSSSSMSQKEIKNRFLTIEKVLATAEEEMIDINRGLYLGIAYELDSNSSPEPKPLYALWKNLNNHVGFKGTTRVGKTVNMQGHIDQCIAKGWDVIVLDPKGGERQEVLSGTAESCSKHNRANELMYFSPAFEDLSHKINTLYGKSNLEVASMIVDSISEPGMESFYLEVATRILLAETTAYEYLQAVSDPDGTTTAFLEREESRKYNDFVNSKSSDEYNLMQEDIIDRMHSLDEERKELEELPDIGFNRTLLTFRDLEMFCSYDGLTMLMKLVRDTPMNINLTYSESKMSKLKSEALRVLNSALKTDIAHFSKVSDTLGNRLLQLSIGPIGEMLCGTRINPLANRLKRKDKGVVAVIQSFPMKFKKAAEMFNKTFLGMLDSMMGTVGAEGRTLPRRLAIFIDEAGAVFFPGIESFFNRAGGLGISCFIYTQSDEDYKLVLGDTRANVIMDNVNTRGIMRQNFTLSAQNASEDIGRVSTYRTTAMISAGGGEGRYSTEIIEEYLCKPTDIQKLPMGEGILTHDGKNYYMEFPYRAKPAGAFRMPELESEKSQKLLIEFEEALDKQKEKEFADSIEFTGIAS